MLFLSEGQMGEAWEPSIKIKVSVEQNLIEDSND
jgi:hypothetical protein